MNFKNILAIALTSLVLFSCSKDNSVEKNSQGNNTSFQPTTIGSTWNYQDNINSNGNFTLTATGQDTTVNGMNFSVFADKPDSTPQVYATLFGQSQNDYYTLGFVTAFGNNALLYLKDTTVNATWSQDVPISVPQIGQTTAELDFTLAQSGISYTLNGKTYPNVAHVTLLVKIQVPGLGLTDAGVTGDIYFARGVGILSAVVQQNGSKVEDVSLVSYTIKP
ncbi:MAG: hypothetical protein ACRDE2_02670 [Chitinophagaceae bacterium]